MARTYSNPDLAAALGKTPQALLHDVNAILEKPERPGHRRLSLTDCALVALYLEAKRVGLAHYPARMIFSSWLTRAIISEFLDLTGVGANTPRAVDPVAWAEWLHRHPVMVGAAYDAYGDIERSETTVVGISFAPFLCLAEKLPERLKREDILVGGQSLFATAVTPAFVRLVPMIEQGNDE